MAEIYIQKCVLCGWVVRSGIGVGLGVGKTLARQMFTSKYATSSVAQWHSQQSDDVLQLSPGTYIDLAFGHSLVKPEKPERGNRGDNKLEFALIFSHF